MGEKNTKARHPRHQMIKSRGQTWDFCGDLGAQHSGDRGGPCILGDSLLAKDEVEEGGTWRYRPEVGVEHLMALGVAWEMNKG